MPPRRVDDARRRFIAFTMRFDMPPRRLYASPPLIDVRPMFDLPRGCRFHADTFSADASSWITLLAVDTFHDYATMSHTRRCLESCHAAMIRLITIAMPFSLRYAADTTSRLM